MKTALIALMFLAGCATANMVEERGTSQYAPSNEVPGGRVTYKLNGADFIVRARREDAYKQMHEKCGGSYRIIGEQDAGAGSVSVGGATTYGHSAFGSSTSVGIFMHIIDFECGASARARPQDSVAGRIGLEVGCSAENVAIEKTFEMQPGIIGYDVVVFGDRYLCAEDSGGTSCRRTEPSAARE